MFQNGSFWILLYSKNKCLDPKFDILQIHCCNFVTVHLQLSLPIYCSNLKVFLWRLYFIPTVSSCPIHFIRTIQSKLAARGLWNKFRGLCLSLWDQNTPEPGPGWETDRRRLLWFGVQRCVQCSTVQYSTVQRCWERAGDGRIGTNISGPNCLKISDFKWFL